MRVLDQRGMELEDLRVCLGRALRKIIACESGNQFISNLNVSGDDAYSEDT